ncbi:MAG TPA: hypothetical protein VFZ59_10725, partial [Verrucomicrobiae bacterium]|nr:hypothetical protein [Verrucomicrobiae bacterium]
MLDYTDAGFRGECECEDFTGSDVPRVIGFGEFSQGEPGIGQRDSRLGPRTAQRRTCAQKET